MATQQYLLSSTAWTLLLSGPVETPARVEACRNDAWLWSSSSAPSVGSLGVRLREEKSDLITLESGENLYGRANEVLETIVSVTS